MIDDDDFVPPAAVDSLPSAISPAQALAQAYQLRQSFGDADAPFVALAFAIEAITSARMDEYRFWRDIFGALQQPHAAAPMRFHPPTTIH